MTKANGGECFARGGGVRTPVIIAVQGAYTLALELDFQNGDLGFRCARRALRGPA